tara:strand:- start:310 stop:549 length:240 start_codon:yes stop_codon:yes gene_type:complete
MIKNFIIIVLSFVVFSLMVQKPENVDIIVKDAATAKEMVVEGVEYVHKTFDKEFSVHSDEEYEEEHGEKRIEEDTWFKE